jgi:hypothetical protein
MIGASASTDDPSDASSSFPRVEISTSPSVMSWIILDTESSARP